MGCTQTMQKNSIEIKDVLATSERVFSAVGAWPLKKQYVKFTIAVIYCSLHLIMVYVDLYHVFGNLELLVDNLMESLVMTLDYVAMFILRCNKSLARTIATVRNQIVNGKFESVDEMRLYYYYNNISSVMTKYMVYMTSLVCILWYICPSVQFIQLYKDHGNISTPLILPFRIKTFFDYSDYRVFLLIYLYEMPLLYIGLFHINVVCLIICSILHVCGRLSVLSHRIRNIPWQSIERVKNSIADIVEGHLEIIRVEQDILDVFSTILLLGIGECTLRMAFSIYLFIVSASTLSIPKLCTFSLYVMTLLILLYSYCYAGEQLMHECRNMQDAYYYCNWEDMPNKCKKSLMICMIHAQRTLRVTAGGFYTFSLQGFTDIIKTSMAYVSMLRTMI